MTVAANTTTAPTAPNEKFVPPSGDDEALIAWVEAKREKGKKRIPHVQMRLSMAMVLGHQWAIWDRDRGRFATPITRKSDPNPPVRITANKIGGIVERSVAKLTKEAPMPVLRPTSEDDKDADTAKVGTRLLEHELARLKWDSMLTEFYLNWVTPLGYSYVHPWWDTEDGPAVGEVTPDGKIPNDSDDPNDVITVNQGNIKLELVPGFELAVDPNGNTMEDALWAVRTTSWTKEAVWNKWGVYPEAAEYGGSISDDVYALSMTGASDQGATSTSRLNHHSNDFVYVHQFWMKPCRAVPKGMVLTYCGKTILDKKESFPYKHKRLPFIQFNMLPGMGTREGRTWVTDLIPLQIDYNDARSREATIRRLLTPKVLAPTGSIDPNRVTARVEIITYAPTGDKPTMMIPDSGWMAQFEEGMNRADQEMGDRAGQSDASAGRAPASQPAASILALQESDDTKLAISVKQMNAGIEKLGTMLLALIQQFWNEDRTIRTYSDTDGQLEIWHYQKGSIDGEFDVHVASESGVPRSAAARAQLALDLNQRGIPPFTDPMVLMKFIDMSGSDIVMDALNIDTRQAHRENGLLMSGVDVEIHPFDKHFIHAVEHSNIMKTVDYEQLPPEGKARVMAHYEAHMQQIAALMASQDMVGLQMAGMPMGGGGGAGGGGPRETINFKDVAPQQQAQMETQAGLVPPPANQQGPAAQTGIGGPGQPGHVPGQTTEQQMAHGATARK